MNALVSTFLLLAGLAQTASAASSNSAPASPAPFNAQERAAVLSQMALQQSLSGDAILPDQARENVLVLPTPDLPADSLADLTEDMTVMCRIFDKAVPPARVAASSAYGAGAYGDRGDVFRFAFGPRDQGTQGLYLDGYGAIFFIHVDYPLVPTEPPEQAQAKPKEPPDTVWSQTVKEMSGQPGEEPTTARTAPAYDPQRVENLKKTLITTLAHTANIRMRRPQDAITLVVGALDDSRPLGVWGRPGTSPRVGGGGSSAWVQPGQPGQPGAAGATATVRNPAGALMILRVTKADVDTLAKGQLTSAQFTEKIQSFWTPRDQGTPTTAPAPTTVTTGVK